MHHQDLTARSGRGSTAPVEPTPTHLHHYINLKLAMLGQPAVPTPEDGEFEFMAAALLERHRETERLLSNYLSPADWRIQRWLEEYLYDTGLEVKLPTRSFVLDRAGLARALSLPPDGDAFTSDIVSSYRLRQGVLHNPKADRRTTVGTFHIADGGLAIPDDKIEIPCAVFARLLREAFHPPAELLRLPFTASQPVQAECFVSLLLRPVVCPGVPGFTAEKSFEVRFFAPGNLVGNLDFVESIFGNAGDPYLPENDAGLDIEHWTGHSGCVVLAPHLTTLTKRDLGLPPWDQATPRQRRDGMCWRTADEPYNDGRAFKATARDARGVTVTVIADNYFGYCKKEVKTQISFAANLFGQCEEEHAGGAAVYTSFDLGEEFSGDLHVRRRGHHFDETSRLYHSLMDIQPEGYGIDRTYPDIIYVPNDVFFDLDSQTASWSSGGVRRSIKLLPERTYVRPSGYKVHMEKPPGSNRRWRLVGTAAEPTVCHKPCTVSGGGKSEISKSLSDAIITGPVFVADFKKDFDAVADLIARDYSGRFADSTRADARPILSHERSLGSVIKLLTPDDRDYSAEYNAWLEQIPQYIKELVFVVKRYFKPDWGQDWRRHFSVDLINGRPGNELKCDSRPLVTTYLRVGFDQDGSWRTFGMRKDFHPAAKVQTEDDISASVVVPSALLPALGAAPDSPSVKFVKNCESRLFQRPDDAVHRGYDRQTEADFARTDNFFSNYEPLTPRDAAALMEDTINFYKFTKPMQRVVREAAQPGGPGFFASTAHPRMVGGKPSKNPRYLQHRPDLLRPRDAYLASVATRLSRRLPLSEPVLTPVSAVLPGRRNNPPDAAAHIRPLCVHNPIHYLELPELFMEYVCSMTGKSPSTTGAGSEGALTKGPFNSLLPIIDLNAALVSNILCGAQTFLTAAGFVGPQFRVDHDISLLVPEVWCRMSLEERVPANLLREGCLEKCEDSQFQGKPVLASRLGYRITEKFVRRYFGRIFNHPHAVFTDGMLRPELQDPAVFADSMENMVSTHRQCALHYFNDGSIDLACPPLRALLTRMRSEQPERESFTDPEFRALFTRESLLSSDWYQERLRAKQRADAALWQKHLQTLEAFLGKTSHSAVAERLGLRARHQQSAHALQNTLAPAYLQSLQGTLGIQPELAPRP